jgi:hypothetical protein
MHVPLSRSKSMEIAGWQLVTGIGRSDRDLLEFRRIADQWIRPRIEVGTGPNVIGIHRRSSPGVGPHPPCHSGPSPRPDSRSRRLAAGLLAGDACLLKRGLLLGRTMRGFRLVPLSFAGQFRQSKPVQTTQREDISATTASDRPGGPPHIATSAAPSV